MHRLKFEVHKFCSKELLNVAPHSLCDPTTGVEILVANLVLHLSPYDTVTVKIKFQII